MDDGQGHAEYKVGTICDYDEQHQQDLSICYSLQELFNAIDVDNSGYINIKEMVDYLHSVCDDEVDEEEVRVIFSRLDVSGDRTIDFDEFEVCIDN